MNEIKFKDWRLTGFWVGLVFAALVAGFVFGWTWRDIPSTPSHLDVVPAGATFGELAVAVVSALKAPDGWAIASAIGTLVAAVAALATVFVTWRIAQAAKNLSGELERREADTIDTIIRPELLQARKLADSALREISPSLLDQYRWRSPADKKKSKYVRAAGFVAKIRFDQCHALRARLHVLPKERSLAVGRAIGELEEFKEYMNATVGASFVGFPKFVDLAASRQLRSFIQALSIGIGDTDPPKGK
ncbi:hypothetical protein ACOTFF_15950 [Achromobacter xylosoxidans]